MTNFKLKGFLCQGYSQFPYYYVIMMEEFTPMQERRFLTEILDNDWIDSGRLWMTFVFNGEEYFRKIESQLKELNNLENIK